jgi:hypothetical protein
MPILVLGEKRYPYNPGQFTNRDALAMEKATGMTYQEWMEAPFENIRATQGLVWLVLRNNGQPDLAYDDVVYGMGEIGVDLTEEEQASLKERLAAEAKASEAAGNPTTAGDGNPPASSPSQSRPARGAGRAASPRSKSGTGSRPARSSTSSQPAGTT